jgi:hypothetical protein
MRSPSASKGESHGTVTSRTWYWQSPVWYMNAQQLIIGMFQIHAAWDVTKDHGLLTVTAVFWPQTSIALTIKEMCDAMQRIHARRSSS